MTRESLFFLPNPAIGLCFPRSRKGEPGAIDDSLAIWAAGGPDREGVIDRGEQSQAPRHNSRSQSGTTKRATTRERAATSALLESRKRMRRSHRRAHGTCRRRVLRRGCHLLRDRPVRTDAGSRQYGGAVIDWARAGPSGRSQPISPAQCRDCRAPRASARPRLG